MNKHVTVVALVIMASAAGQAVAEVPLSGTFVAREACPALQSIRKETNPGSVRTEPDRCYPLIAKNKPAASHYLIEIQGAEPPRRWVGVSCGEHLVAADGSTNGGQGGGSTGGGTGSSRQAEFVLAVSWQPAFCEGKPDKTECTTQSPTRFDATNFTLHGLFPQPRSNIFCGVSPRDIQLDKNRDWENLPEPNLDPGTRRELETVMPGTASFLERHEWIKHGTCFQGESADEYFARTLALMKQLNASQVRSLLASKIGSEVTGAAIRDAFDASFGDGAGERVRVACKRDGGRNLIVEITIGLAGQINDDPSLEKLIAASQPTDPGCPRGIVDPVGLQ